MARKRFDASVKQLIADRPEDFARWLNEPADAVALENVDLSVSQPEVDAVLRLGDPPRLLLHIEAQVSSDPRLETRLLKYHAMLLDRGQEPRLPVRTVVLLLRPPSEPLGRRLSGRYRSAEGARLFVDFFYEPIRLWEQPPEPLLEQPGTLPLATLSDLEPMGEQAFVQAMARSLERQPPRQRKELAALSTVFAGLRPGLSLAKIILERFPEMKESTTYKEILSEGEARGEARGQARGITLGRLEAAREHVLRLGTKRFGPPSPEVQEAIEKETDLHRLEVLFERAITADSWDQVLSD